MLLAHALNGAHVVTSLGALPASAPQDLVSIPDLWLTFVVGTVLPAIVAFVTSRFASSALKAIVLVFLSVVGGVLIQIQQSGGTFDWRETAVAFFMTFVTAVAVHFGFLKPAGVTGSSGAIQTSVPGGLGGGSGVDDTATPTFDPGVPPRG